MNRPAKTTQVANENEGDSAYNGSPGSRRLTGAELKCMKTLWFQGASTVRDVHQALQPNHPVAYTTVLTVMNRLTRKGVLARTKRGKAHYYLPQCSFEEARKQAVAELIQNYFDGSADQLAVLLAGASTQAVPVLPQLNTTVETGSQLNEHLL